jgi:cholesterol 7-desaturase
MLGAGRQFLQVSCVSRDGSTQKSVLASHGSIRSRVTCIDATSFLVIVCLVLVVSVSLPLPQTVSFQTNNAIMALTGCELRYLCVCVIVIVDMYILKKLFSVCFCHIELIGRDVDPLMHTHTDSPTRLDKPVGTSQISHLPNGFFRVCDSIDLNVGEAIALTVLNRRVIVLRGSNQVPAVLDASCVGCDEDLQHTGNVDENNDTIVCKNCWARFNLRNGLTESGIDGLHQPAFQTQEANGHIYMWHDADGAPPTWYVPCIEELNDGTAVYHGRSEHLVSCVINEIPENGADTAHLGVLHRDFIYSSLQPMMEHSWQVNWAPNNDHTASGTIVQSMTFFHCKIPGTTVPVQVTQIGPGVVLLEFSMPGGTIWVIECVTPVKQRLQRYHHIIFATAFVPRPVCHFVLDGLVRQAERDIPVWNHKVYMRKPLLVQNDGPIMRFRRWFGQFYQQQTFVTQCAPMKVDTQSALCNNE